MPDLAGRPIAYFSAEFGLHETLPIAGVSHARPPMPAARRSVRREMWLAWLQWPQALEVFFILMIPRKLG